MKEMKFSPLFWPIKFKKEYISVLDETELPAKVTHLKIYNYRQAALAIKNMKTRSVGQVILVLYTFLLVYQQNKGKKSLQSKLEKTAAAFNCARPTLSFKYLTDMVLGWHKSQLPLDKAIYSFLNSLEEKRVEQARQIAAIVKNGDTILTHCNISGLLPLAGSFCRRQNKDINFYVTETRPYLQGARLTAWELSRVGFAVTVICDNMVAQVMKEKKISKVVVGADNLARNGDVANKVGTFQIALLAKEFKIPFYAVCPPPSAAKTGKEIKIEVRPEKELLIWQGKRIAPKKAKGYYPAFDITPYDLITGHIFLEI